MNYSRSNTPEYISSDLNTNLKTPRGVKEDYATGALEAKEKNLQERQSDLDRKSQELNELSKRLDDLEKSLKIAERNYPIYDFYKKAFPFIAIIIICTILFIFTVNPLVTKYFDLEGKKLDMAKMQMDQSYDLQKKQIDQNATLRALDIAMNSPMLNKLTNSVTDTPERVVSVLGGIVDKIKLNASVGVNIPVNIPVSVPVNIPDTQKSYGGNASHNTG